MIDDRHLRAVHEAGHVVIGELFGLGCIGAAIEGLTTAAGKAGVLPSGDPYVDACVALGGFFAQIRAYPDSDVGPDAGFLGGNDVRIGSDAHRALSMAGPRLKEAAEQVAGAFRDERVWALVERVADALYEHGTLNGRQLQQAMYP